MTRWAKKTSTTTAAMRRYRDRMRAQGLRPVQLWVPDTRSREFVEEFKRQALTVARHEREPSAERDEIDAFLEGQDDAGWTS